MLPSHSHEVFTDSNSLDFLQFLQNFKCGAGAEWPPFNFFYIFADPLLPLFDGLQFQDPNRPGPAVASRTFLLL